MATLLRDEGEEVIRDEIIDAFRCLEKLGAGQFVIGRGTRPSRFVWRTGMVSLGRRAAGLPREADALCEERRRRPKDNARAHTFHLRADWPVTFHLPLDLAHDEIERLAAYLKTLPMTSGEKKAELPHRSLDADPDNHVS